MEEDKLTTEDKHHWSPIPQVLDFLKGKYSSGSVLDVGPGHSPLPWATASVDFVDVKDAVNLTKCDLANEPFPFADKQFDFVYARHILEDMFDPFPLVKEMERVGKSGYIECPSPICELTRGVDGGSPKWRGYHHHRFIVWVGSGELRFITKYPLIEYLRFHEQSMARALRIGPKYWNTYYLWNDKINWKHRQSPLDFDIMNDYGPTLADACHQSMAATNDFWSQGISEEPEQIPAIKRTFA